MYQKILYGILLITVSIAIFYLDTGFFDKRTNYLYSRSNWPSIPGTVLSSRSYIEPPSDDNLNVTVEFRYTIAGIPYSCTQTWSAGETDFLSSTSNEAQVALRKYTPGAAVQIYYDPIDPKNAVVETRVIDAGWENYVFGVAFIIGMASFVVGIVFVWKGAWSYVVWLRLRHR
jgi:hypothetical protein